MSSETHFTAEQFTPTAITTTFPIRVTITDHGFTHGQALRATRFYQYPLSSSPGMWELNNRLFYVGLIVDVDNFTLTDEFGNGIDGRNYTPYVSNGQGQLTLTGPKLYVENHIE